MKDLSECYKIARLISARISETITPEEQMKLDAWLAEDERHRKRFCRIQERLKKDEKNNIFRKPEEILKDMEKVKSELSGGRLTLLGRYPVLRYAAVAALVIGVAVTWMWQPWGKQQTEVQQLVQQEAIFPGSSKVILTLADGEQVSLQDVAKDSLWKDGVLIQTKKGELLYEKSEDRMQQDKISFNKITIPRSGEYKLTLADGTRVWLNSATELKYPVEFKGNSRQVFLQGEAYFEVVADMERPFVVTTPGINVNVLGTGFNVMAYPDDAEQAVTLVHGKVGVRTEKQQVILQPDEQYVYQSATHQGTVRRVDVAEYIGWKEGVMNFDSMPLDELTHKLSRWYDVDFFFTSEQLKNLNFSGAFKKYNELRYVLNIIEEITDVRFVVNNRTVIVNKK